MSDLRSSQAVHKKNIVDPTYYGNEVERLHSAGNHPILGWKNSVATGLGILNFEAKQG